VNDNIFINMLTMELVQHFLLGAKVHSHVSVDSPFGPLASDLTKAIYRYLLRRDLDVHTALLDRLERTEW